MMKWFIGGYSLFILVLMLWVSWEAREKQCINSRVVEKIVIAKPERIQGQSLANITLYKSMQKADAILNCGIKNEESLGVSPYFQNKVYQINSRFLNLERSLNFSKIKPINIVIDNSYSEPNWNSDNELRVSEQQFFKSNELEKELINYWVEANIEDVFFQNKIEKNLVVSILELSIRQYFGIEPDLIYKKIIKNGQDRQYWSFVYAWFEVYNQLSTFQKNQFVKKVIESVQNNKSEISSFKKLFVLPFNSKDGVDEFVSSFKNVLKEQPIVFSSVEEANISPLKSLGIQSVIVENCANLSIEKLNGLDPVYSKILLVKNCDNSDIDYYSYRFGIAKFASRNKKVPFVEVHLPSLKFKCKDLIATGQEFMKVFNSKEIAQKYFGWNQIIPSADGNYYQPKSTIDAVVSFRM